MATVQDLVNLSLTLVHRLGPGRTAGPSESAVVLGILNGMLDSWSTERLTVYSITKATYALAAGTETYTIGTGGVFNVTRPVEIQSASIQYTVEGQTANSPLKIIGQDEYSQLQRMGDQAVLPRILYNDKAFPLSTLALYPIPATNTHLVLYTWTAFAQFVALTDACNVTSFPNGYYRALSYCLAIEVASAFSLSVPDSVAAIAREAKGAIQAINSRLMGDEDLDRETAPPDRSARQGNYTEKNK